MKGLNQFSKFDLEDFLTGKDLTVTGCGIWKDYNSGAVLGTKVDVVVSRDDTAYKPSKNGPISNLFEKLSIKIPRENVNLPTGSIIAVISGVGTIYGDFRNQLSIRAEDVKVVTQAAQATTGDKK